MNLNRAIEQSLQSWKRAGLADFPRLDCNSLLQKLIERSGDIASPIPQQAESRPEIVQPVVPENAPVVQGAAVLNDLNLEQRTASLENLRGQVAACQKCAELAGSRKQTVFGVGNPNAKVMFIGEAPGAEEDKQGVVFVGQAGQLLTSIIQACGWTRDELYICNILRCRPPGNRNPSPVEADNCKEFLEAEIETVDPDYIVCLGTIAAQNLLSEKTSIGRLRGTFHQYKRARVLCTYHPAYLLRNESAKRYVWEDMKILLKEMGIDPARTSRKKGNG